MSLSFVRSFGSSSTWSSGTRPAGSAQKAEHNIYIWNRAFGRLVKILEGPKEGILDLVVRSSPEITLRAHRVCASVCVPTVNVRANCAVASASTNHCIDLHVGCCIYGPPTTRVRTWMNPATFSFRRTTPHAHSFLLVDNQRTGRPSRRTSPNSRRTRSEKTSSTLYTSSSASQPTRVPHA